MLNFKFLEPYNNNNNNNNNLYPCGTLARTNMKIFTQPTLQHPNHIEHSKLYLLMLDSW